MRSVRLIIAALLALSLAVTPAVARAAFAVPSAPSSTSHGKMAAMPDCHRAAMQHEAGQSAQDTHHKTCPDCEKRSACNADVCQLKCFKVLSAVGNADRTLGLSGQRLYPPAFAALEPQSFKPQPPPPRT